MFELLQNDVYNVFTTSAWTATGVKVYPVNYQGKITAPEFARLSILPARAIVQAFGLKKQLSGMIIVSIFLKAGDGDKRIFQIADKLSQVLDGKRLPNGTSFKVGSVRTIGLDSENAALYRADYSNNFTIYGE